MDDELDNLRREAEREALTVALQMLRSPATPATARASVVRGVLGDAATRRHDEPLADKDYGSMTAAELASARRALEMQIARSNAAPLELEVVADAPAGGDVFG
ncbi:hypothetical protein [Aureimonas phyllosphaerae]|uniref:Uncharacterized protein n=1 Tax=Aureimonas phyllosphaerae TaxID=1166078 RepID=A0A7W6FWB7_9HYPH|nr:hypothetical protein [Aureimonas phyllosphaerae]MBB3938159.1 hypothetical protein [Aureimonas phyllosphaerae]MBB3962167.1 hypothetical protein [Aureimonas phyllosphaerae]SFF56591.1 hypothetical protein SAMN05216566_13013 [Aureimonas phyllosphaerae]